jgi:serine/threonine protein kinase
LILHQLSHPLIVTTYGLVHDQDLRESHIVLELSELGSVSDLLYNHAVFPALSLPLLLGMMTDTIGGIIWLHKRKVLHRDIKAENLLLFPGLRVKLCDTGESKQVSTFNGARGRDTLVGTFGFIAPEVAMTSNYDRKSDVYSWGVMCLQMLARRQPSWPAEEFGRVVDEAEARYSYWSSLEGACLAVSSSTSASSWPSSPSCVELLRDVIVDATARDLKDRMSADEVERIMSRKLLGHGLIGGDPRVEGMAAVPGGVNRNAGGVEVATATRSVRHVHKQWLNKLQDKLKEVSNAKHIESASMTSGGTAMVILPLSGPFSAITGTTPDSRPVREDDHAMAVALREMEVLAERNKQLQSENEELKGQIVDLKNRHASELQVALKDQAALKESILTLQAQNERTASELRTVTNEKDHLIGRANQLQLMVDGLQLQVNNLDKERASELRTQLEIKETFFVERIYQLQSVIDSLQLQIAQLEAKRRTDLSRDDNGAMRSAKLHYDCGW